jgi:hypothetical protein
MITVRVESAHGFSASYRRCYFMIHEGPCVSFQNNTINAPGDDSYWFRSAVEAGDKLPVEWFDRFDSPGDHAFGTFYGGRVNDYSLSDAATFAPILAVIRDANGDSPCAAWNVITALRKLGATVALPVPQPVNGPLRRFLDSANAARIRAEVLAERAEHARQRAERQAAWEAEQAEFAAREAGRQRAERNAEPGTVDA